MSYTATHIDRVYVTVVLVIVLTISTIFVSWANAEELISETSVPTVAVDPTGEPTEVPVEASTDASTAVPTEMSTENPTDVSSEPPAEEPTDVPVETPTDTPTEVPAEMPTEPPTDVPTEPLTEEPTKEPTEIPTKASATEPIPIITWNQPEPVMCASLGEPAGLSYQESQTYRCSAYANVTSDTGLPAHMAIIWTLNVEFPDSYRLELPAGSAASMTYQQSGPSATGTTFGLSHPWQQGDMQRLDFDVVVTRTLCIVGDQVLVVQASPQISTTDEAEIYGEGVQPAATTAVANYLPNVESPSVSMTPVDFGSLKWRDGAWGTTRGTSVVTVTHNQPCAISQAQMVQLEMTSSDSGLQPIIVAIHLDDDTLIALPTDNPHGSATVIAQVPAGFHGTAEIEVVFELSPATSVAPGDHTFAFWVDITSVP